MKRFGFLLILLSTVIACQKDYNKNNAPYKLIPAETTSVIKVNTLNEFVNSNNTIISSIYNKGLKHTTTLLENLNTTRPLYISFFNKNESDYLILTENDSTLFTIDSLPNHSSETLTTLKINKTKIDTTVFYHKVIGNVFASSNNLDVLKNINTKRCNDTIIKLLETTETNSIASVVFKTNSPNYSKLLFSGFNQTNSTNYSVLDLNYSNNSINYNGITKANDSVLHKIDCFKNTIPQKINTIQLAPYNTKNLVSITFDDYLVFNQNLSLLDSLKTNNKETFLNLTNEIALVDNTVILHSLDIDLVLETIEDKLNIETHRGINIYEFGKPDFFKSRLQPFIEFKNAKYFTVYKDFIIFSNTTETLKSIVSSALNTNTLANTAAFKSVSKNLSDEASLFIFNNAKGLSEITKENTKGYDANVVQFIYENNYAHVNGVIQKFTKNSSANTITEAFTTTLDAAIITSAQTVKNHITKAHDIAVQDANNILYLISSSGNILWKKKLQGKILGEIEQIDTYKNGRLQLAFSTPKRLYVLDRNGNDVSDFPIKFNDEITQPLSVFDYDNRKNYRLLVTQGKNLLMYDVKGKSINGFNYKNNGENITTQPKHFRIANKDYITFAAGNNLKILNRQGKNRIKVDGKIRFSNNSIYLYQNKFTTTNTLGQLVQVDTKGKAKTKNLNLTNKHHFTTTSKTFVSMIENTLKIKSRTIDLDYGNYTAPKIFYINDKIYVTTTDLESNKVYLFDSQAKSIPNFPVFGTSSAELQKLDNNKGIELITQSDEKTIVVYKLH